MILLKSKLLIAFSWRLAILLPLLLSSWLEFADVTVRRQLFRLRGALPLPNDLVVLSIDEASIDPQMSELGAWPWSRTVQAKLAVQLLEQGARTVVFNIVHAGPSRFGVEDDQRFVELLSPWRKQVVLSASLVRQDLDGARQVQLRRSMASFSRVGLSSFVLDPYGMVQSIPGQETLNQLLRDFPLPHYLSLVAVSLGKSQEIRDQGINFWGLSTDLPLIPAWTVDALSSEAWKDKIVIIGSTAPSLGDQLETPFGQQSGSEVLFSAIASELEDKGFRSLSSLLLLLLFCGWALGVCLCLQRSRDSSFTLFTSFALMSIALGGTVLSWIFGLWLPSAALLLSPLLGGGLHAANQFRVETRQRQFLHSVLSKRVSPLLLKSMLLANDQIWEKLGGQRSSCVVLFADLVGFTKRSSEMSPEALFRLLNLYFEAISKPVLDERGLLDKFIGDSLMAEFGVPQNRGDCEEVFAAARAALAMQANLQLLNKRLISEGQAPLMQGIGIHLGEVFAGNLGSKNRLEFTVIGSSVNLASRIESLTRIFPEYPILISRPVRELLGDAFEGTALGFHALKGWPDA